MRFLILSEISELKLKNDENYIVFEKCHEDFYSKKINKSKLQIYNPNILRKIDKNKSFDFCDKIYEKILKDISIELNKLHDVTLSYKSWEIIFGNWLRYFIWTCYERYTSINKTINNIDIKEILIKKNNNFEFHSRDTDGIYYNSIDDEWNSNLYYKVLKYLNIKNLRIFPYDSIKKEDNKYIIKKITFKDKILKSFLNIFKIINTENSAVVLNTYLPKFYEKLFEILLFQIPTYWDFGNINYKKYDYGMREKINLDYEKKTNIENFIRKNIKFFLPISTVESFEDIMEKSQNVGLPKNPKFIFTSNDYEHNEIFKFYVSKLSEKNKSNYYIGQHGVYFSDIRGDKLRSEFSTPNKFLTWGYSDSKKFIQSFNFATLGRKKYQNSKKKFKKFLITVMPMDYKIYPYSNMHYLEKGFSNVLDILKSSNEKITKNAVVRLHEIFKIRKGKFYLKKYFDDKSLNIDFGAEAFHKVRQNSRLTFFNYDSTGILENLSLNYPTICMWDDFDECISDDFIDKYRILIDAKILFLKRDDLKTHLNSVWDNIDEWWLDKKTQKCIELFNQNFNIQGNLSSLLNLKKICLN